MEGNNTPRPGPKAPRGVTRDKVAALHAEGKTPRQIADTLGITTQAVYPHLKSIRGAA